MKTFLKENYYENIIHVSNDFPFNIYPCRIPEDFIEVPLHWHNEMEIIYIKEGNGLISLDFESFEVTSGDIIIVKPGQLHGISRNKDHGMDYENIIFSLDMFFSGFKDSLWIELFNPLRNGNIAFKQILSRGDRNYDSFAAPLDRCDEICSTFPSGYKFAVKGSLYNFFFALSQNCSITKASSNDYQGERMRSIIKFIEDNYSRKITIGDAARHCNIAPSSFMRFFKKNTRMSFVDYLNNYRISIASKELLDKNKTVTEIANSCGFDNISYFNRLFRAKYHLTPGEYRRKQPTS